MNAGKHSIRFSVTRALLVAVATTVIFLVMNADFEVGSLHLGVAVDPGDAIRVTFAFLGVFSFMAILFYVEARPNRGSIPDPNAAFRSSEALMTREPIANALAMVPIHAVVFAAVGLLWSLLTANTGASNTVWGGILKHPCAVLRGHGPTLPPCPGSGRHPDARPGATRAADRWQHRFRPRLFHHDRPLPRPSADATLRR